MGLGIPGPDPSTDLHAESRGSSKRFLGWVTEIDWAARFTGALSPVSAAMAATKALPGILRFATDAEAQAATFDQAAITPAQALLFLNANQDAVAALTGWRRGTAAQRAALTAAQRLDRLKFEETDTGFTWVYSTAGGYWFRNTGQVTMTIAASTKFSFGTQSFFQVPFDTALNDDANLFTTTTGANASIRINRSGLYRVSALVAISADATASHAVDLRDGTTNIREGNIYAPSGRAFSTYEQQLAEGDLPKTLNAAAYSTGANPYLPADGGTKTYAFQVARIGD